MKLLNDVRNGLILVFFAFICLYVFTKLLGPIPFAVNSVQTVKSDLFSTTGTGEVNTVPTTAHVSLGVTKTTTSADTAKNELNTVINDIIEDLKALGIEEKNIKTTNFSVNPDYSQPQPLTTSTRPGVAGETGRFTATANLEVETKDVETANKAVDAASAAGANLIGGVTFEVSDDEREKLEDEARIKAIADAKAKAEKIAKAAGLRLGRVVTISESGGTQPYLMEARAADMKAASGTVPTDLQPGENTVRVDVTLSFETL